MPRLARTATILPNCPHHVVLRGNNRRRLFSYPYDYRLFLRLLESVQIKASVTVHAHCLMPNHVHLLLTPRDSASLAVFIKRVAQRFAQHRNRDGRGTGKLFEQRYYGAPIQSEAHLAVATMYIELNPVRAGLRALPDAYRWSSARRHLSVPHDEADQVRVWAPSLWYGALAADAVGRGNAYRVLMDDSLARDAAEMLEAWVALDAEAAGSAARRPNRGRAA